MKTQTAPEPYLVDTRPPAGGELWVQPPRPAPAAAVPVVATPSLAWSVAALVASAGSWITDLYFDNEKAKAAGSVVLLVLLLVFGSWLLAVLELPVPELSGP